MPGQQFAYPILADFQEVIGDSDRIAVLPQLPGASMHQMCSNISYLGVSSGTKVTSCG